MFRTSCIRRGPGALGLVAGARVAARQVKSVETVASRLCDEQRTLSIRRLFLCHFKIPRPSGAARRRDGSLDGSLAAASRRSMRDGSLGVPFPAVSFRAGYLS